jgi:thioredoxin reductase (NADPH)
MGGTISRAVEIENYPGFKSISGIDLAKKMHEQAEGLGVEIKQDQVEELKQNSDQTFTLKTMLAGEIQSKTIIITTGTKHRHLNAPGEKRFSGKGISYCATCDGYFFKDKKVAVIGGGDSAATAGLFLGEICSEVYIIFRKPHMRAEPFWIDKMEKNPRIIFMPGLNVAEFQGAQKLENLLLDNGEKLPIDGAFIQIGSDPETSLADQLGCNKDKQGHIMVDAKQETSVAGAFAAGDVTDASNKFEQIATAVSEGSIAANAAFLCLQRNN